MLRCVVGVCWIIQIIQYKAAVPTNVILSQHIMIKNGDEQIIRYIWPAFYTQVNATA